jgi:predicted ATP-dependent endonuclease of OLD family
LPPARTPETYALKFSAGNFDDNEMKNDFKHVFRNLENLKPILKQYTPIEDFRFSNNYNIFIDEEKENCTITNLYLEFKIDGNWLPFSSLSDGTKRLFYIISEVNDNTGNLIGRMTNNRLFKLQNEISRIILIEEPELGIHPHQFHQLMQFLKIESETKQIIITTHSPEALNVLNANELNRIIIASIENTKEGT